MIVSRRRHRIIQEYLDEQRTGFSGVAKALGVSYALVYRTARGHVNNKRVLRKFLELGIPADTLDIPEAMLAEFNSTER